MLNYISYGVAFASMLGTVENSFQKKWCFYIWMCTNTFWLLYNIKMGQYAQGLLYLFNFSTAIIGLFKWKKR